MPLIRRAIECTKHYHKGQRRDSGEPFYLHPVAVANIVSDYTSDVSTVIAAILHDVVEDTIMMEEVIALLFGKKVFDKVMAITNLRNNIKLDTHNALRSLYHSYDKEVVLIKLCDRLHNMRTIKYKPRDKRRATALQTMQTFIPLARYIEVLKIEQELSEICLQILGSD